ncbi:MAG: DUF4194 domain-containing protein [Saccharospirillum sp.]
MSDFFDRLTGTPTAQNADANVATDMPQPVEPGVDEARAEGHYTARPVKSSVQELLKFGLLEAERKPNLYQTAIAQTEAINAILEPLDLRLKVDDIRGLAFLVVAEPVFGDEEDDWSHPLVRRQRLTMEQSLLVAILRQHFVSHEQEAGLGAGEAKVELEELLPQLQLYLGDTGSDARDQKRLRTLLEALKGHGIVSDVDSQDQVIIRPIITHLANPENLKNLLQHFRKLAGTASAPLPEVGQ